MDPNDGNNPRPADEFARQRLGDLRRRGGCPDGAPERIELEVYGKREVWIREGPAVGGAAAAYTTYKLERP